MIAKLTGLLDQLGEDFAVVDVGGVGYIAFCSGRTLAAMPAVGEPVSLQIETHVREDHIHLYGFAEIAERDWFRLLTTVQGVGAKVALGILSVAGPSDLADMIAAGDKSGLTQAPGVGPKLAGRIASELKEKASQLSVIRTLRPAAPGTAAPAAGGPVEDAVSALVNLGYRPVEAHGAVAAIARTEGEAATVEVLIREGLKELAR